MRKDKDMNRSEELCKLLEIEPIKKDCPHKGCRNHITHPCEICNNRRFIFVYPDLTKPSNFVKLLEITLENMEFKDTIFYGAGTPIESFVDNILETIEFEEICEQSIKDFKHQAQATEWDY